MGGTPTGTDRQEHTMQITHEHEEIRRTLKRFIDEEINPHVEEWEAAEAFPAHQVFKRLGQPASRPNRSAVL